MASSSGLEPFLPDGWKESYYCEMNQGNLTFVTAVYEHLPTRVKFVIEPEQSPERDTDLSCTQHKVWHIYPTYEDLGVLSMYPGWREFDDILRSVVPEVDSSKLGTGGVPEINSGPYRKTTEGDSVGSIGGPRAAEGTFAWEEKLPQDALKRVETLRVYPIDYQPIIDNSEVMTTIVSLHDAEPELIQNPYPADLVVRNHERQGEWYISVNPVQNPRVRERIIDYFNPTTEELEALGDGTAIGTVWLQITPCGTDYERVEPVNIECTEAGEQLRSHDSKSSIINWVRSESFS